MNGVKIMRATGSGLLAAAVLALLPAPAQAASGDFSWSTSGVGALDGVLSSPQSGRCYSLSGNNPPFYSSNNTDRTVRSYQSSGCRGEAQSTIGPGEFGHVFKYVKFD
ncbi:hypothetical protein ACWEQ2_40775 [Streptomyces sp. NPDC004096]|uniref:hypothetical protein n=1 Tax=unclassified Streptomyces TaxID=2593676 RepID=UPI0033AAAD1A